MGFFNPAPIWAVRTACRALGTPFVWSMEPLGICPPGPVPQPPPRSAVSRWPARIRFTCWVNTTLTQPRRLRRPRVLPPPRRPATWLRLSSPIRSRCFPIRAAERLVLPIRAGATSKIGSLRLPALPSIPTAWRRPPITGSRLPAARTRLFRSLPVQGVNSERWPVLQRIDHQLVLFRVFNLGL